MNEYLLAHQTDLFTYSLMAGFTLILLWEMLRPWVKPNYSMPVRWWNNIALFLVNRYFVFWLLPITIISAALYAQENAIGLLNLLNLNNWLTLVAGILIYDLFHYGNHWIHHKIPLLWRLHRLHHSDPDVDVSTELKHHPFESLVSALLAVAVVIAFGIHPVAIILRTLVAQIVSLFSHANVEVPQNIDNPIRKVLITPAMHRIHHSSWQPETDSNYGTLFSFWDRFFGTYVDKPRDGYESMELGLDVFRSPRELWLDRLLVQPFQNAQVGATDRKSPLPDHINKD